MKWHYNILLLCGLAACTQKNEKQTMQLPAMRDTVPSQSIPQTPPAKISAFIADTVMQVSHLDCIPEEILQPYYRFLRQNLSTKGIKLLNPETLACTQTEDNQGRYRFDTLHNSRTRINLIRTDGDEKMGPCQLLIDGKRFKAVNGHTDKSYGFNNFPGDLEIYGPSFRHFSFRGRSFYYFTGGTGSHGGSADFIRYHFIYDVKKKALSWFENFRVEPFCTLGDLNGDEWLDFIFVNNDGGFPVDPDTPNYFKMQIYSHTAAGIFSLLKGPAGRPWEIEGHTGHELWVDDSLFIQRRHWPKPFTIR